jgi:hypothetical protein
MWEQSRKRPDKRPIGRAKPRSLMLTSQNRELVPQQHQLHVLGELGPTAADEQPQNGGEVARGFARPLRLSEALVSARA